MKDRIPTHHGRVELHPVEGQPNTYDLIRADAPVEEGTPLNKAALLKDSTAALYGLDETAVPDDVFKRLGPWEMLAEYTIAGNYTFIVPDGITELVVFILGGGGSGAVGSCCTTSYGVNACGGGSGYLEVRRLTYLAMSYDCIVGAGGASVSTTISTSSNMFRNGNNGGSSSFGSSVAIGGKGGWASVGSTSYTCYAAGGQPAMYPDIYFVSVPPCGGIAVSSWPSSGTIASSSTGSSIPSGISASNTAALSHFKTAHSGTLTNLAAGGGARYLRGSEAQSECQAAATFKNGKMSSAGKCGVGTASKGTDPGCGGGACVGHATVSGSGTITSAAGADGAVWVFGR